MGPGATACVPLAEPAEELVARREKSPFGGSGSGGLGGSGESSMAVGGARWALLLILVGAAAVLWPHWHKKRKERQALEALKVSEGKRGGGGLPYRASVRLSVGRPACLFLV